MQRNSETSNPNVIIVITDDQGYGDIGYNGNKNITVLLTLTNLLVSWEGSITFMFPLFVHLLDVVY